MKKALGSWSGMRKYLEKEMLATTLQGRLRYHCTGYAGMEDCHIFSLYVDDKKIKSFSWETVNTYFINNGFKENQAPVGVPEYWAEFWTLLDKTPVNARTEYTDEEFCEALKTYRNQEIEHSLNADNPLVRMFAIFDRRVGRRALIKLKETVSLQPAWLAQLYLLRFQAEQI